MNLFTQPRIFQLLVKEQAVTMSTLSVQVSSFRDESSRSKMKQEISLLTVHLNLYTLFVREPLTFLLASYAENFEPI